MTIMISYTLISELVVISHDRGEKKEIAWNVFDFSCHVNMGNKTNFKKKLLILRFLMMLVSKSTPF